MSTKTGLVINQAVFRPLPCQLRRGGPCSRCARLGCKAHYQHGSHPLMPSTSGTLNAECCMGTTMRTTVRCYSRALAVLLARIQLWGPRGEVARHMLTPQLMMAWQNSW